MITEPGQVVAEAGDRVWVMTIRQDACASCSARHGCGQKALAAVSNGRANQVLVDNVLGARVGDEVLLAIEESALLGASVLVYAVPLMFMVVGTLLGTGLGASDSAAMVGAFGGLAAGFAVAKRAQSNRHPQWEPRMTEIFRPATPPQAASPS